jgi:hypothetical protein
MPLHRRHWKVEDITLEEMVDCIAQSTFVLCQGFRCDGILWLHDSAREGDIQEWAIIRESDGRQLESITTGWLDNGFGLDGLQKEKANILEHHNKFVAGAKPQFGEGNNLRSDALEHPDGSCARCA